MTRLMRQQFTCCHCGAESSAETAFSRWTRENPELDSAEGTCIIDQDYWVHRFKTYIGREFQLLMGVEVKTFSAKPTPAQRDTLIALNQVLRNRRSTPTKENKYQAGTAPMRVFSSMQKREICLRVFGVHLLTFSGSGPEDSSVIMWNHQRITKEVLTKILRFDLDPDTLNPIDLRSHHKKHNQPVLHGMEHIFKNTTNHL
jgi:hypothetical protein